LSLAPSESPCSFFNLFALIGLTLNLSAAAASPVHAILAELSARTAQSHDALASSAVDHSADENSVAGGWNEIDDFDEYGLHQLVEMAVALRPDLLDATDYTIESARMQVVAGTNLAVTAVDGAHRITVTGFQDLDGNLSLDNIVEERATMPGTRQGGEETGCDPLSAIGDVFGAVPVFLSANGGFESALAAAVQSLEPCTIEVTTFAVQPIHAFAFRCARLTLTLTPFLPAVVCSTLARSSFSLATARSAAYAVKGPLRLRPSLAHSVRAAWFRCGIWSWCGSLSFVD